MASRKFNKINLLICYFHTFCFWDMQFSLFSSIFSGKSNFHIFFLGETNDHLMLISFCRFDTAVFCLFSDHRSIQCIRHFHPWHPLSPKVSPVVIRLILSTVFLSLFCQLPMASWSENRFFPIVTGLRGLKWQDKYLMLRGTKRICFADLKSSQVSQGVAKRNPFKMRFHTLNFWKNY